MFRGFTLKNDVHLTLCIFFLQNFTGSESCSGTKLDGNCYQVTSSSYSVSSNPNQCKNEFNLNVALLPTWYNPPEIQILSDSLKNGAGQLEAFIGYKESGSEIVNLDGVPLPHSNLYEALLIVKDGDVNTDKCFGINANGLTNYHCSEGRNIVCSDNSNGGQGDQNDDETTTIQVTSEDSITTATPDADQRETSTTDNTDPTDPYDANTTTTSTTVENLAGNHSSTDSTVPYTTTTAAPTTTIAAGTPVTAGPGTSTTTHTGDQQNLCACNTNYTRYSPESLEASIQEMKKALAVDKKELSSAIRLKTCAPDPRPSSVVMGSVGIVIISVICAGIIFLDLPNLFKSVIIIKNLFLKDEKTKQDLESHDGSNIQLNKSE